MPEDFNFRVSEKHFPGSNVRWLTVTRNKTLSAEDFRRIAVGMKGAIEGAHMGHPDFRANGRIVATLHPDLQSGMVKLTPEQQQEFVREHPGTFVPENGAWGRQGCTRVRLDSVDEETLGEALTLAWQNTARKLHDHLRMGIRLWIGSGVLGLD